MKFLKLSILLLAVLCFNACGDDDADPVCTQAEWTGTYEGSIDCAGDTEDAVVTITASGTNDVIIIFETPSYTIEYDPLTPSGCDIDRTDTDMGITLTVDVVLDGDNFTLIQTVSSDTGTNLCTLTATRN